MTKTDRLVGERKRPRKPRKSLAQLAADKPELFRPGYFLEPVMRGNGFPPGFTPSHWDSRGYELSKRGTAARERDLKSDDPLVRIRARGNIGKLR